LELGYFQEDGPEDVHLANLRANIREGARLDLFSFAMGGKLSKKKFVAELLDSHAHCSLNGLYVLDGSSSDHEQVTVRHRQPHATSSQLFKGILNDRSRAEFSGTIEVDPGAIKTDAQQLCRNLLLSSEAQVHTRPQLRILADDVKCSHGATTGQLDQEQILYLRSRGLSPESAIRMLTYGFAREVVERCHIDTLRQQLESRLTKLG
jgi:Fe-S cluster assembly protein SufD